MFKPYTNISNCPDDEQMKAYLQSLMQEDMRHRIEKHMLFCSMCSDYAEGLEKLKENDFIQSVAFSHSLQSGKGYWRYYLSAAAVLFVVFISTKLWWQQSNKESQLQTMRSQHSSRSDAKKLNTSPEIPSQYDAISHPDQSASKQKSVDQMVSKSTDRRSSPPLADRRENEITEQLTATNLSEESRVMSEPMKSAEEEELPKGMNQEEEPVVNSGFINSEQRSAGKAPRVAAADASMPVQQQDAYPQTKERDRPMSDAALISDMMKNAGVFYAKGEWKKAALCLQKVLSKSSPDTFNEESYWMLANCFLKLGEPMRAKDYFERLVKTDSKYKQAASDSIRKYQK